MRPRHPPPLINFDDRRVGVLSLRESTLQTRLVIHVERSHSLHGRVPWHCLWTGNVAGCQGVCCVVLCCVVLCCVVLCCVVLCCLVLSCLVLSCLVLSCLVLSCLVLCCVVLLCLCLCLCQGCLLVAQPRMPKCLHQLWTQLSVSVIYDHPLRRCDSEQTGLFWCFLP